jgi:hypothetical protein
VTDRYCPACRGHGTNVHECESLKSAVVPAADLLVLLDYLDGSLEFQDAEQVRDVRGRLREAMTEGE